MPHWFVAIDTVRLRRSLVGANARAVDAALAPAAKAARVRLIDAVVIGCGVRAVVAAARPSVRHFARRLVALARRPGVTWRPAFRMAALVPAAVPAARALVREMKIADEEPLMIATSSTAKRAGDSRKLATLVRHVERSVDSALGADDAAARVRRYVAEHDAPPDDRVAFARLCTVVFAQGIGYEAVVS